MSYRGGYNRGGNFPPNYGRYQRPQPYPQPNGRNEIYEFRPNDFLKLFCCAFVASELPSGKSSTLSRKKFQNSCHVPT